MIASCLFSRRRILRAALASTLPLPVGDVLAQDWNPNRPIKLVVTTTPGGGSDIVARLLSEPMSKLLGQPVVVENKAGASGTIASEFVYRAPADGYTLLMANVDTQAMYPHLRAVGYDPAQYTAIGGVAQMGYVLMGRPGMPATLAELRSRLRTQRTTYGSAGAGTSLHVFAELFARETGAMMLHVPYKGPALALQDLMAGQIDLMMVPLATALQSRVKLVSYGITSAQRDPTMMDVPTLKETGLNVVGDAWAALVAPPGTPAPVANRLSAALETAVAHPQVNARLREMGLTPFMMTRPEFSRFYSDEYRKWGEVIKAASITLD
jgi:tripartite-type tricarboxylate transporter receptor subunit TctC